MRSANSDRLLIFDAGESLGSSLVDMVCQYFTDFSDKACCFEDLKPYVSALSVSSTETPSVSEMQRFLEFLEKEMPPTRSTLVDVQRTINAFKLQRFAIIGERTAVAEHDDAMKYLKAYFDSLPVGASTSLQNTPLGLEPDC